MSRLLLHPTPPPFKPHPITIHAPNISMISQYIKEKYFSNAQSGIWHVGIIHQNKEKNDNCTWVNVGVVIKIYILQCFAISEKFPLDVPPHPPFPIGLLNTHFRAPIKKWLISSQKSMPGWKLKSPPPPTPVHMDAHLTTNPSSPWLSRKKPTHTHISTCHTFTHSHTHLYTGLLGETGRW